MTPLAPPPSYLPAYSADAPAWRMTPGFAWERGSVEEMVALIEYCGLVVDAGRMAAEGV